MLAVLPATFAQGPGALADDPTWKACAASRGVDCGPDGRKNQLYVELRHFRNKHRVQSRRYAPPHTHTWGGTDGS